mgnify:FL=1
MIFNNLNIIHSILAKIKRVEVHFYDDPLLDIYALITRKN